MLPPPIQKLIAHFSSLPGVGAKTAERFVFYLLNVDKKKLDDFALSLTDVKNKISACAVCGRFTDQNPCVFCSSATRDKTKICLVADTADIYSLEKTGEYRGQYHVLNGLLSPTEGMTPDKLNLQTLENRIKSGNVKEIILALNPTIEGETTSLYLTKLLRKYNITISRLARGLPQGADLEYADEVTLANALKGRMKI